MNTKLYVGNLLYEIQEQDLIELFQQYGQIITAEIVRYKKSGRSKGFGFVTMATPEEAATALQQLHDFDYRGRKLMVGMAKSTGEKTGDQPQQNERKPQEHRQHTDHSQEQHQPELNHTPYVPAPQVHTQEEVQTPAQVRTENDVQTVSEPVYTEQVEPQVEMQAETYESLTPPAMNEPETTEPMEEQQMQEEEQMQMQQSEEQSQAERGYQAMESAQMQEPQLPEEVVEPAKPQEPPQQEEQVQSVEKKSIFDHMKKYGNIFNRKDRSN